MGRVLMEDNRLTGPIFIIELNKAAPFWASWQVGQGDLAAGEVNRFTLGEKVYALGTLRPESGGLV